MSSSVWPARRALFGLMVADPGYADVQITLGVPTELAGQEVVSLLGVTDPDETEPHLGGNRKREDYVLEVKVMTFNPGALTTDEGFAVEERNGELVDVLRAIVHTDRTLGGVLVNGVASVVRMTTDGAQPAANGGMVCFSTVGVRCRSTVSDG